MFNSTNASNFETKSVIVLLAPFPYDPNYSLVGAGAGAAEFHAFDLKISLMQ